MNLTELGRKQLISRIPGSSPSTKGSIQTHFTLKRDNLSQFSVLNRRDLNFCVRSTPLQKRCSEVVVTPLKDQYVLKANDGLPSFHHNPHRHTDTHTPHKHKHTHTTHKHKYTNINTHTHTHTIMCQNVPNMHVLLWYIANRLRPLRLYETRTKVTVPLMKQKQDTHPPNSSRKRQALK